MSSPHQILVIDDNPELQKMMAMLLSESGYDAVAALSGQIGLTLLDESDPDLVILDISMPGVDGWEVCRQIREKSNVPIMFMTAAHVSDEEIVKGLDLGANDYVIKPFRNDVFLARIRNALRWGQTDETELALYDDGHLTVNLELRQVTLDGNPLKLTRKEYEMLTVLIKATPRVVTHSELFENVWDSSYQFDVNYVRIFIGHLRKKVEINPAEPIYIHNERGVGYRFLRQPQSAVPVS